jgi:heptosyltransferase II
MVTLVKLADKYLGSVICRFLSVFKGKSSEFKSNKILLVQLWGIGETVLTLPAIEALRDKYPKAEIEVLATKRNKDVYSNNHHIDKLQLVSLNPFSVAFCMFKNFRHYDLAIDMEEYLNISAIISFFAGHTRVGYSHGRRSGLYDIKIDYNDKQHASQTYLDLIKVIGGEYELKSLVKVNFSKSDKRTVDSLFKTNKIKNNDYVVCVAPGAAESARCRMWPLDRYAQVCDEVIAKHKAKVIFVGTLSEFELVEELRKKMESSASSLNFAGVISLTQLFYLVTKCKLFIGNDSGPMHVAAAQGIKTIGLFGPNLPERFGPLGKGNVGIYKGHNCEYSPCINVHKGQVPDCLYPRKSNDYQKCVKNISVDDVLKEI